MSDSQIIVALDGKTYSESLDIAARLHDKVWGVKVNDLFFDPEGGLNIVEELGAMTNVMLDMKLHDIPNTVKNQTERLARVPVDLLTVHASGGARMIAEAVKNMPDKIVAVTCLTSLDPAECEASYARSPPTVVTDLAKLAAEGGAPYLVCSPKELSLACFDPKSPWGFKGKKIVPGIRPEWFQQEGEDQRRTMTPAEAILAGADLLVMGRPILKADDMIEAVDRTNKEIDGVTIPESA